MKILDKVLAPGLSTPAIIYTPSAYDAGVFRVSRLPVKKQMLIEQNKVFRCNYNIFIFLKIIILPESVDMYSNDLFKLYSK